MIYQTICLHAYVTYLVKTLPQRHTRGIPKPTYEHELSSKVKYLMSHYVSNHCLAKSNMSFVNHLSIVSIFNSV